MPDTYTAESIQLIVQENALCAASATQHCICVRVEEPDCIEMRCYLGFGLRWREDVDQLADRYPGGDKCGVLGICSIDSQEVKDCGLREGDLLLAVNGADISGLSWIEVV